MLKRAMRHIHPGEIVLEEVIKANDLTITQAAKLLGVTRTDLSNIVNQKSDISQEMAYRIATVFGGTPDIWANMQTKYNLHQVEGKVNKFRLTPYQPGRTQLKVRQV
jgi:addiction module HigA family antidote